MYLLCTGEFLKVKWKQFAIDFDNIPVLEEKPNPNPNPNPHPNPNPITLTRCPRRRPRSPLTRR